MTQDKGKGDVDGTNIPFMWCTKRSVTTDKKIKPVPNRT